MLNLQACINCNLCVRACREVQSNDVIGMAFRGNKSKVIFDFDDEMGSSTCVRMWEIIVFKLVLQEHLWRKAF